MTPEAKKFDVEAKRRELETAIEQVITQTSLYHHPAIDIGDARAMRARIIHAIAPLVQFVDEGARAKVAAYTGCVTDYGRGCRNGAEGQRFSMELAGWHKTVPVE